VRITTGGQPYNVDVHLIDLRIRSGAAPANPVPAAAPPAQSSRDWLLAALCVALVLATVLVIAFGAMLYRRSRSA